MTTRYFTLVLVKLSAPIIETIVFTKEILFFHVSSLNSVPPTWEVRPSANEACMMVDLEKCCSSLVDLSNAHTLGKSGQEESQIYIIFV